MLRAFAAFALLLCLSATAVAQQHISRADRTKMRETRETMRSLAQDLNAWAAANEGSYPDKLNALLDAKLREELPKDAWGNPFTYSPDEQKGYRLVSMGGDGKDGGEGAAADIIWTREGESVQLSSSQRAELSRQREYAQQEARIVVAKRRMVVVGLEALKFRRDQGKWPQSLADAKRPGSEAHDKAINACFSDPWGNPLELRVLPAENVVIVCWGKDAKPGGTGHDADFVISERDVQAHLNSAGREGWDWRSRDWQAQNLAGEVSNYMQRAGKLPDELADLTRPLPDGKGEVIRGFAIPTDRWGNEYVYLKLDEVNFAIVGLGKDGRAGGVREDADTVAPAPGATQSARQGRKGIIVFKPEDTEAAREAGQAALVEVAIEQMNDLIEKLAGHKQDKGAWPEKLEEIAALLPGQEVPLDPWDNAFVYELATDEAGKATGFTLTCLGSDGEQGGEGHAADIIFTQDGRKELPANPVPPDEAPPEPQD